MRVGYYYVLGVDGFGHVVEISLPCEYIETAEAFAQEAFAKKNMWRKIFIVECHAWMEKHV